MQRIQDVRVSYLVDKFGVISSVSKLTFVANNSLLGVLHMYRSAVLFIGFGRTSRPRSLSFLSLISDEGGESQ